MVNAWLTPDELPSATKCVQITVPDDEEFYAMLIGALTPLFESENFENEGTLTAEECAQWWVDWFWAQTWPDCP